MTLPDAPSNHAPSPGRRAAVAAFLAIAAAAYVVVFYHRQSALAVSDFDAIWTAARALRAGHDPYAAIPSPPWPRNLQYPLPAVLVALPFSYLPLWLARAAFMGVSTALLAWGLTGRQWWPLILLAGGQFLFALQSVQWSPPFTAAVLLPGLRVLWGLKPTTGAPARLPLYPFLAAVYPIVALAAANSGEVRPSDLVRPVIISVLAAVALWLASRAVSRASDGRALVTFVAVAVFGAYGYAVNALTHWVPSGAAVPLLAVCSVTAAAVLARRSRVPLRPLTMYLNLALVIMVGWASASLLWHWRPRRAVIGLPDLPGPSSVTITPPLGEQPHLFLVILDQYTGHRSLAANFDYDNTRFETMLEQAGFVVPRAGRANYVHTFLALAAMLNWQYLDDVAGRLSRDNAAESAMYPLIEVNRTSVTLRRLGYRLVFLPTWLPATRQSRYADLQLPDPIWLTHEFEAVWVRGTLLYPLLERLCPVVDCSPAVVPYVPESAASLDWKLEQIPTLARSERPVFVLAHLILPHEPYVYDAECRHRRPYWPASDVGPEAAAVRAAYVAQIQCVNRKMEIVVREILRVSSRPAIIMLQADHGHGRFGGARPSLAEASAAQVRERTDVFAAYRLPGAPRGLVYDSISPVNAMRAVMRYYYGLDLPPLPDASFWSSTAHPYDFVRVP